MNVNKVLSHIYLPSDTRKVFSQKELSEYLDDGYSLVRKIHYENFEIVWKEATVRTVVELEDGSVVRVDAKRTILANLGGKISAKKADTFFNMVRLGLYYLEVRHGELIAYPMKEG